MEGAPLSQLQVLGRLGHLWCRDGPDSCVPTSSSKAPSKHIFGFHLRRCPQFLPYPVPVLAMGHSYGEAQRGILYSQLLSEASRPSQVLMFSVGIWDSTGFLQKAGKPQTKKALEAETQTFTAWSRSQRWGRVTTTPAVGRAFTLGHFFHPHMYEAGVTERTFPALPNVPTMAELPLSCEQESH